MQKNTLPEGKHCPPCFTAPQTPPQPEQTPEKEAACCNAPPQKPTIAVTPSLLAGALASYAVGWLYVKYVLMNVRAHDPASFAGYGLLAFCACFFGGVEALMRKARRPAAAESLLIAAACLLLAADITAKNLWLRHLDGLEYYELWALHGLAAYWVVCRAGLLTQQKTGPFLPWDGFQALVLLPFGNFFLRARVLWAALVKSAKRAGCRKKAAVWPAAITLLAALPVFCFAVSLLSGADGNFGRLLQGLAERVVLPKALLENLGWFVWGLPVGAYLFGLAGGALRTVPRPGRAAGLQAEAEHLRAAPKNALTLVLAVFSALYLAFFALQASYLLGGFTGRLPQGFTAANYARQGFFELCAVVLLNFCLLAAAAKCSAVPLRQDKALKALSLALCAANLFFCAVSFSKLYLYVSRFALTPRRVLSSWFVLVLAVLTVLAIATILRPFGAIRAGAAAVCVLFLALCLSQPQIWLRAVNRQMTRNGLVQEVEPWLLEWEIKR